ncbi:MAG: helix-turn-helix transcriptional regulator [Gemmobacter sp.]
MIEPARFSRLIAAIYDCAVDPAGWDDTLAVLRDELTTVYAALHLVRFPPPALDRPPLVQSFQTPWDPVWLDRLLLQLDRIPAFAAMRDAPIDSPQVQRWLVPDPVFETTGFYRDWVRPQGLHDACNTPVIQRPQFTAMLSLWTDRARRPLEQADLDTIRLITPHLRRAIVIGQLIADGAATAALAQATLDRLAVPVVLVEADGRITATNAAGAAMLVDGAVLVARTGRLDAAHAPARAALAAAIAAAADEAAAGDRGGGIPLTPPAEGRAAAAYVLPLGQSALRHDLGRGIAAVFVADEPAMQPAPPEVVAALTGLTTTEARVALALARGQDTETAAAALGIAGNTLRKHLANIYDKTGLRSRAALVARVGRMVVPVMDDPGLSTPSG